MDNDAAGTPETIRRRRQPRRHAAETEPDKYFTEHRCTGCGTRVDGLHGRWTCASCGTSSPYAPPPEGWQAESGYDSPA